MSVDRQHRPAHTAGPFLHKHDFDEAFYVLEGELVFQVEDAAGHQARGRDRLRPARRAHTFTNQSDQPARYVLVCTPAGFERYFAQR